MNAGLVDAGREVCVEAVQSLQRGWYSARVVGAGGYASTAEVARLELPGEIGCTNPFSARCRLTRARAAAALEARRREVVERIRRYRPSRELTGATDIEGTLAAIDDALRAVSDSTWTRHVILATDLVSSGGSSPVTLRFALVDIDVWVQWPGDATRGRRLRDEFTARVRDAGARSITYHSLTDQEH